MTDKEIIKALECCHSTKGGCKDCPLNYRRSADCVDYLEENALDLIRRQQEKINHFAETNKMVVDLKTVKTDKTEDEILKRLLTQRVEFIPNSQDVEDIKRDAVREFAEKLKREKFCRLTEYDEGGWAAERLAVKVDDIDELVNEMFGNPE